MKLKQYACLIISLCSLLACNGCIGTNAAPSTQPEHLTYNLDKEPYISPRIIEELNGNMADPNPITTSIDLDEAIGSNQYHGDFSTNTFNGNIWIEYKRKQGYGFFAYRYIAKTPSGTRIVMCADSGGGSGTFMNLLLIKFSRSEFINGSYKGIAKEQRDVIEQVGYIVLGDRYNGEITYKDGTLTIGADTSMMMHGGRDKVQIIAID